MCDGFEAKSRRNPLWIPRIFNAESGCVSKFSTFQVHPGGSMHEPCRYALFSGTVCIILSENTFVKYMFRMQNICI